MDVLIYALLLFVIPFIYQYKLTQFFWLKCKSLLAAIFLTSLVNFIFYVGSFTGWIYYSFNANVKWDTETLTLAGIFFTFLVFVTNLFVIIICFNVRKRTTFNKEMLSR